MKKYLTELFSVEGNHNMNIFPGLNAVKGILIILIIFTHSLPEGMLLYFNYLFHMPVFLAVSGYLLKESAFKYGLRNHLERLLHRLIIPWIIATICYLPLSLHGRNLTELTLTDFIYPFFHLWYVPAYMLGVLLCYAVLKFKISPLLILLSTAIFTIIWYDVFRSNELPVEQQPLYYLGEKRFYSYLFFFFLAFSLRNNLVKIRIPSIIFLILIIIGFGACVVLVYQSSPNYWVVTPYMVFNTSLVLFLLISFAPQQWLQYKLILWINKQSLGIYLYHPLIIFAIYHLLGDPEKKHISNLQGLIVGCCTLLIIIVFIWLVQKSKFANKLILGITQADTNTKDLPLK